jgi:uncharacterized repeat protein (TIGR03803 family)
MQHVQRPDLAPSHKPRFQVGGSLYGMAGQGGTNGYGVVWSFELGSNATTVTVLHNFEGGKEDCATPFGALTYNPNDGKIYGMSFSSVGDKGVKGRAQDTAHDGGLPAHA